MGLVVDNFAGGGGASVGIGAALGFDPDIAINHDPEAIRMHKTNHPTTKHYCESVWDVDPIEATQGKSVDLAWFSPDCKHFSKAKGKKPVSKNIRGLAWVAIRWAKAVRPRVIMLENVEEFKTWGPLIKDEDGNEYPDPNRKGETYNFFIESFRKLGYQVSTKELRACDYGAPTIRKRFFLIARCDGQPIVWPTPTHGNPEHIDVIAGLLKPWRSASDIIDWSLDCPSIFERKRPLAENTLRRIAKGFKKFVLDNPDPFIVRIGQTGFGKDNLQYSLEKPLTTVTTKAEHLLITPYLINYHTETRTGEVRGSVIDKPLATVDTANRHGLVTAFIARSFKSSIGSDMNNPFGTITTGNKSRLVTAFLMKYYGSDIGQDLRHPLHTITTKDRFGLVTVHGVDYRIVDIGLRMLQPHELYLAQGFPAGYIIDEDYEGNRFTKAEQVKRCGNAVPPPFAKVLVTANLPELCDRDCTKVS